MKLRISLVWFSPLLCFFGSKGHVALDRNPGPGYDTLLLRMILGDLLSAFPHRQFHTLPGLLDSWVAYSYCTPIYTDGSGLDVDLLYITYLSNRGYEVMRLFLLLKLQPLI